MVAQRAVAGASDQTQTISNPLASPGEDWRRARSATPSLAQRRAPINGFQPRTMARSRPKSKFSIINP
ncbi:hypothetical protein A2U01_0044694 [Trifolium medium]|uniref:Uncharacterized protein n=1 Tax=Trifolium medium TaxID=97028 RepID=A0A392QI10_9FABA|nr:hypothetical protein [Trifolium medium]